jgi:hypothetical protein
MRNRFFSSILVVAALLIGTLSQASASILYTGSGVWDAQAPTTAFSQGGKSWSFSFELDNPANNPTTSASNFTFTLNGNMLAFDLLSVTFYPTEDSGMFKLSLTNGLDLNFYDPFNTDIGSNGQLKTGQWNVEIETFLPGETRVHGVGVVAAVPEPSTWAMMILGFAAVGFFAYRRRNNVAHA